MGARSGLRRSAIAALLALVGCVEQARSADVIGEVPSTERPAPPSAPPGAPQVDVGEVSVRPASAPTRVSVEADSFFGERPDGPVLRALRDGKIKSVEKGKGGRSLGFKVMLDTGEKAYFKGEQTFSAANWFGEVASFHLDRMLGIGRVPAIVSRVFPWDTFAAAAGKDFRRAEIIIRGGMLQGALVSWVTGPLTKLPHTPGWERWVRVQHWPSAMVTPFQRPLVWKQQMDRGGVSNEERARRRSLRPEPDREDRAAELSDVIVFDYLTRNQDRWGGENANVLIRGPRGPLVFLDNGASFEPGEARPGLMEARIHAVQRFRRRTIAAVRAFDMKRYKARLATELVQPVLNDAQLAGLEERMNHLLEWVAHNEMVHGEAIWAWE